MCNLLRSAYKTGPQYKTCAMYGAEICCCAGVLLCQCAAVPLCRCAAVPARHGHRPPPLLAWVSHTPAAAHGHILYASAAQHMGAGAPQGPPFPPTWPAHGSCCLHTSTLCTPLDAMMHIISVLHTSSLWTAGATADPAMRRHWTDALH